MKRIQTFINTCLRRILQIHWPDTISNKELWERTSQQPVEGEILKRRWRWIGQPSGNLQTAPQDRPLPGTSKGKGKGVDLETPGAETWRQKPKQWTRPQTWGQLERLAQDRGAWRALVGGLCPMKGPQAE